MTLPSPAKESAMFTRLLVPLDGSSLAETALPAAKLIARRFGAELYLVHAEHPLATVEGVSEEIPLASRPADQVYLECLAQQLTEEGITAHTVLPPANPAEGILAQAELDQVDLIVMATHGRTGFDALLHPSVTWQVFSRTTAPILVCKRGEPEELPRLSMSLPRFMTDATTPILVPLDGSLQAEAALPLAQQLAQTFGNPVRLVRVVAYPLVLDGGMGAIPYSDEMVQWLLAEAENYLKVQQAMLASQGLKVEIESTLGFSIACLGASVQEHHAGLVVMTSHGRGWLGRLVLGSVAKSLLGHLDVPILLARSVPASLQPDQHQAPAEVLEAQAD
jgi:nucleotide-binding universal stress UspA family protein